MMASLVWLAALAALMVADVLLTLEGLRLGLSERNPGAVRFIERFGAVRGLWAYQGAWFALFALIVALWPSQWAALAVGCVVIGWAVLDNINLIRSVS